MQDGGSLVDWAVVRQGHDGQAMNAVVECHRVTIGPQRLAGVLKCPPDARGLVVFAHGSGSNSASPRNRYVAGVLHQHRQATLMFDLLSAAEAADRRAVFDIALLAGRVTAALDWLREPKHHGHLCASMQALSQAPVGLFGASTGAAAALWAAAERPGRVGAVVSRGGRVDLAAAQAPRVQAPTLLIVGGADTDVLALNREVLRKLVCKKRLEVVPGATHLFEEPGALDAVAQLAADWFARQRS
jgi:putative phosphoribosyl transferase